MKNPAFYTASLAIGDCIAATATIRKLSEVYNTKVVVFSHYPDIFDRLPYVERSEDVKEFITLDKSEQLRKEFDLHYSFWRMGQKLQLSDDRGVEMKHSMIDIRQYHAIDNGFTLLPHELHCDFRPNENEEIPDLPENFVCLHPFKNWPSRTWESKNWEILIEQLIKVGIPVVLIGKDSLNKELVDYLKNEVTGKTDERVFHEIENRERLSLDFDSVVDLTNKTTISQAWQILNKAKAVVTMDSGILHLAGTTDTHIIQLGSSINNLFRAPYRHGRQDYKYSYVSGSCGIFCASNMKYSLRDWENGCNGGTPIQCVSLIDTCLEKKDKFECHPTADLVFNEIVKVWETNEFVESPVQEKTKVDLPHLVKIQSKSLGDQIGSLAAISEYAKDKKVYVICGLHENTFNRSYPDLTFLPYDLEPSLDTQSGLWTIPNSELVFTDFKRIHYKFDKPLIQGYAEQLGVENWERPKIDCFAGERPIKSKYVCFSMHSTAQAKHWNYPGGWDQLCRTLRKAGLTPVCIDRHNSFGNEGWWNEVPSSCVKKQGMNLAQMTNYIHHSEFFIGISSGLSWVAHSLGKKVVMISGVTSEDNEFSENTYRIMNKSVCNGCINNKEVRFDAGDWLWCPFHKHTERQFECSKTITPDQVFAVIQDNLLGVNHI
jgi:autotransporter strand-loop-strand O-heptosyltransferase